MLIKFEYLVNRYGLKPNYTLHVGASSGQERDVYKKANTHVTWIEADPEVYEQLVKNINGYPKQFAICACISDVDGSEIPFYVTNNEGQSSSMMKLGTHAKVHPSVVVTKTIQVPTSRIDSLIVDGKIQSAHPFDFINFDIQGSELKALRGMGAFLSDVKWAYLEVNKAHLYIDCPLIEEIDDYMKEFGFKRVETKWEGNTMWGDAFYIKR